ncbi:hypothetical protein GCM10009801_49890 [Streptomyces albiaxialis]|uniref:Htaa domain-containing protein n=1 Tax=Streptomyces albiaxialis TaxID=329523 RepID=A0ABN2W9X3_9ACTN
MTVTARPRPRAAALAVVTAAATVLGVTAFAPPVLAAPAAPAAPAAGIPLTDGTLDWGIKKSFRDYLTGPIAGGKITVADGAKTNADGSFRFTGGKGSYDTGTHAVDTAFQGSVHLYGHKGALDIELSDLKMVTKGKGGALSADVTTPKAKKNDVELATLDLSEVKPGQGEGGAMTFADIPATLTEGGSDAFEGYYEKGEKLDPVTLAVKANSGGGTGGAGSSGGSGTGGTGGSGGSSGTGGSTGTGGSGDGSSGGSSTSGGPGTSGGSTGSGSGSGGSEGSGGSGGGSGSGSGNAASGAIVDGNLDWGVKKSFRDYITGPIAKGKAELSGGAKKTSGGYRFPKGSGKAEKNSLDASFRGGVRFLGHKESGEYVLDLTFSQFKVKANGTKGSLVSDVKAKDRESGKVSTYDNLTVATLKLPSGALDAEKDVVTVEKAPATLTGSGAKAFGGFYKAGDKLDPVTASVSLDENAQLPGAGGGSDSGSGSEAGSGGAGDDGASGGAGTVGGSGDAGSDIGTDGALASTGADLPSGALMGGAAALAVLGGAAVYAARRRNSAATPAATPTES